jgi:hypothetical protein
MIDIYKKIYIKSNLLVIIFFFMQGFKRDYDTLKALRFANGFEWNDSICEVIAPDEVWNQHLSVRTVIKNVILT